MALAATAGHRGHGPPIGRLAVAIATVLALSAGLALILTRGGDGTVSPSEVESRGTAPPPAGSAPAPPSQYWRTDGADPSAYPVDPLGIGFFAYGDPLATVTEVLGPPDEQRVEPQELVLGDTVVSRWHLAAGSELVLESLPAPPHAIEYVHLQVDQASGLRVGLWGGLVAGRSMLGDVVEAWGPDDGSHVAPVVDGEAPAVAPITEVAHTLTWATCDGPTPMLAAFSVRRPAQPGATVGSAPPPFDPSVLDEPFEEVLLTWADADPGTQGCPSR